MIVWSAECLRLLRTARVLALLALYGMFSVVVTLAAALTRQFAAAFIQAGGMGEPGGMPPTVLGVFYLSLFFLPGYAALMGFDQVSGEVAPRSIRYLTVRARRTSVLLGKLLAQTTLLLGLVFGLDMCLCVYTGFTTPELGMAALALQLLKFWMTSTVFSAAFLALTALCSCVTSTPPVSLVINFAVLMLSLLLWMTSAAQPDNPLRLLRFLSPLRYSVNLLSSDPLEMAGSLLAYAVFTGLFLGGALWALRTRDV